MKSTEVQVNTLAQRGPRILANSCKIYDGAKIMRFSQDITRAFMGQPTGSMNGLDQIYLVPFADVTNRTIRLVVADGRKHLTVGALKVWHSVHSMYCAAKGILQAAGIEPTKYIGSFHATAKKGEIVIHLYHKLKDPK